MLTNIRTPPRGMVSLTIDLVLDWEMLWHSGDLPCYFLQWKSESRKVRSLALLESGRLPQCVGNL
jgi:hypothetical protein